MVSTTWAEEEGRNVGCCENHDTSPIAVLSKRQKGLPALKHHERAKPPIACEEKLKEV